MAKYIVRTEGVVAAKRHRTLEIWTNSESAAKEKAILAFEKANSGKQCSNIEIVSVVKVDDKAD